MTENEIHGTQLRMAADKLESAMDELEARTEFWLRRAQAIADTACMRSAIRTEVEDSEQQFI